MRVVSAHALASHLWLGWLTLLSGCGSDGKANAVGATPIAECAVQAPTECPDPAVTYTDVAPLFQTKCVTCHYGVTGGPWPLDTYQDAADWQDTIRDDVLDCSMPPPDGGVSLSSDERFAILTWVRCGGVK